MQEETLEEYEGQQDNYTINKQCTRQNNPAYQVGFINRKKKVCAPSDVTIDIDAYTPNDTRQPKFFIPDLGLTQMDGEIIESSTSWLSDTIINAAQKVLKKVSPVVTGLQNVNLGLTKSFAVESGEFLQILHTGCGHWHVISTIGTQHPEVTACTAFVQIRVKCKLPFY